VFKRYAASALALLLAACGSPKSRQSAPHGTIAPEPPPPIAGALYRIDPRASELRILVYRAGAMSALGHNHVIVNRALGGWAAISGSAPTASFSLTIPAAGFAVDDAQARSEEGADFAEDVTDEAKSGTLRNMLSPALLDAAEFPEITVRGSAPSRSAAAAAVTVTVAGHESQLEVPFDLESSAGGLRASGNFSVRQSALGLTPYSVMLGALRVQDEIRIKFKLVAVANQTSANWAPANQSPASEVSSR
jgi:polyisoprenoid-binding protein YceI